MKVTLGFCVATLLIASPAFSAEPHAKPGASRTGLVDPAKPAMTDDEFEFYFGENAGQGKKPKTLPKMPDLNSTNVTQEQAKKLYQGGQMGGAPGPQNYGNDNGDGLVTPPARGTRTPGVTEMSHGNAGNQFRNLETSSYNNQFADRWIRSEAGQKKFNEFVERYNKLADNPATTLADVKQYYAEWKQVVRENTTHEGPVIEMSKVPVTALEPLPDSYFRRTESSFQHQRYNRPLNDMHADPHYTKHGDGTESPTLDKNGYQIWTADGGRGKALDPTTGKPYVNPETGKPYVDNNGRTAANFIHMKPHVVPDLVRFESGRSGIKFYEVGPNSYGIPKGMFVSSGSGVIFSRSLDGKQLEPIGFLGQNPNNWAADKEPTGFRGLNIRPTAYFPYDPAHAAREARKKTIVLKELGL